MRAAAARSAAARLPAGRVLRRRLHRCAAGRLEQVALSPGLSRTHSPAAALLKEARRRRIAVVGEIELFARELARLNAERGYAPQVLGVTGTNGKTTTTRLAGLLVERCGYRTAVAGNIAPAALDELAARFDANDLPEVWVLELSSFQLESTTSLECNAANVLNVTQDHLDWHGSMNAYAKAKERIFGPHTVRVLNRDDPLVAGMTGRKNTTVVQTVPAMKELRKELNKPVDV